MKKFFLLDKIWDGFTGRGGKSVKWCGGNPKLAEITEPKHLRKEKARAKSSKITIKADLGDLKLRLVLQAMSVHKGFGVGVRHSEICILEGPLMAALSRRVWRTMRLLLI